MMEVMKHSGTTESEQFKEVILNGMGSDDDKQEISKIGVLYSLAILFLIPIPRNRLISCRLCKI